MKTLTEIAKLKGLKIKALKQLLLNHRVYVQFNNLIKPNPVSVENGIVIECIFSNGLISKSYFKFDELKLNEILNGNIQLPVPETDSVSSTVYSTIVDEETGMVYELPF